VKDVGDSVGKGHSAMLAIVDDDMVDALLKAAQGSSPKVIRSIFSPADEQVLQAIFLAARENE
jgi:uncharacterized membrane protein